MTAKIKSSPEAFVALQEIISSIERISDIVHQVASDEITRNKIDKEIENIAAHCITISENLDSSRSSSS